MAVLVFRWGNASEVQSSGFHHYVRTGMVPVTSTVFWYRSKAGILVSGAIRRESTREERLKYSSEKMQGTNRTGEGGEEPAM